MSIDFSSQRWERVKENARQWWAGASKRPLIQITMGGRDPGRPEPPLPRKHFAAHYGLDESVDEIVDRWSYTLESQRYLGDAFPAVFVNFGPGIAAGLLGARVECDERTVWFHPTETREAADLRLEYDADNPWLDHLRRLYRASVERFQGGAQISMTDLGGTVDVLSVFRPSEKLPLDLLLEPDAVKARTWDIHDLWFRYYDEFNGILQPTNPGYTAWTPIFSETPYYMLQCDFCYMIGPDHFDEFIKPELAAACKRLDHAFYHLDGPGQLAHLDSLLEIEDLAGVQWVPGAGAAPTTEWPEVYRKIRDAGKRIQLLASGDPIRTLDTVAEQLGSAEGIVMLCGAGPNREGEVRDFLKRYGAE